MPRLNAPALASILSILLAIPPLVAYFPSVSPANTVPTGSVDSEFDVVTLCAPSFQVKIAPRRSLLARCPNQRLSTDQILP
jgi:hypothetical protein